MTRPRLPLAGLLGEGGGLHEESRPPFLSIKLNLSRVWYWILTSIFTPPSQRPSYSSKRRLLFGFLTLQTEHRFVCPLSHTVQRLHRPVSHVAGGQQSRLTPAYESRILFSHSHSTTRPALRPSSTDTHPPQADCLTVSRHCALQRILTQGSELSLC